ncbi:uncharacterized protein V2V93DRAFT_363583 [Kockiozyma suomiensis]|uniref:uncharacterized protein n=1 Tax=Kockiozyma suomiensis TaxID=1337062 RepID=UPI003343E0A5
MTSVVVSNISPDVTKEQIEGFFSFCGKIKDTEIVSAVTPAGEKSLTARVIFTEEEAVSTALLLTDTPLGSRKVVVESDSDVAPRQAKENTSDTDDHAFGDVPQEAKPKAAVLAEIMSHGYKLSDKALQRATELDEKHGISSRFSKFLSDMDSKYDLSNKAASTAHAADEKYSIREHIQRTQGVLHRYFEKAMDNQAGGQVRKFYADASKTAADIHNEAKRLAAIREGEANNGSAIDDPQKEDKLSGEHTDA